jgi:hypothetical protein
MDAFSYILKYDSGFAPNPFGGFCTLACCKPVIRKNASIGDWVMGTTPSPDAGRLTYMMQITRALSFEYYFNDPIYENKKNTKENPYGDNIYEPIGPGNYRQVSNPAHNETHIKTDLSSKRVLISNEFFYFGSDAPKIEERFRPLIHTTHGHKRIKSSDKQKYKLFLDLLDSVKGKYEKGIIGEPTLREIVCYPPEDPSEKN